MSGRTQSDDITDWSTLLDRLNTIRLSRDWSYRQLADDMARVTKLEISAQTLQPLLAVSAEERSRPYDRTLYKIQLYLTAVEPKKRATA